MWYLLHALLCKFNVKGKKERLGKFEIFKDYAGEFRFRLKAGNGEIILASEGYTTKASAYNGVNSVKRNAPYDSRFERKVANNGLYMFNLKASNGEVIGTSETYITTGSRDHGVERVKHYAPKSKIKDLT